MKAKWTRRSVASAALTLGALTALGCAEERDPINRVQPDALPKAFFIGNDFVSTSDDPEFYTQGTLIDVGGYGASQDGLFTSTYAQPLSRIKWIVTEDLLVGRVAYERINDSDGNGAGPASDDGGIAVVYPITKHFDISYSYNSATGEELNVIEENSSDRPWYQREYMRVDWSQNLNTGAFDYDTLSLLGIYGGITYTSLAAYENDPKSVNAPVFNIEDGYFDVTNMAQAAPKEIDLSSFGWGIESFPACFLPNDFLGGTAPSGNCNPVELTIRQSFRRVEDTDYEPVHWDGYEFAAYGGFYVERTGYDKELGMMDDKWERLLTRYNIWERSHKYSDPSGMTGGVTCDARGVNGGEKSCADEVGSGSICDTFKELCTLPLRDRTAVTTPWYYTTGSNPDFFDPTFEATHQWDVALRTAVRTGQQAECVASGAENCLTAFPMYRGQQVDNEAVLSLSKEVDDCRSGRAFANLNRDEAACVALADSIGEKRGYGPEIISIAKMPELIVLCHSPVTADDPAACGAEGLNVRYGDLRYHQVNVMVDPATPSPWGIYTDAEDPITGETISASINVWSHVNDLWSRKIMDAIRVSSGDLSLSDVTEAQDVYGWGDAAQAAATGQGLAPRLTKTQVEQRLAAAVDVSVPELKRLRDLPLTVEMQQAMGEINAELKSIRFSAGEMGRWGAKYEARRQMARDTEFESTLINRPMLELAGVDQLGLSSLAVDRASPLRGNNPTIQRELSRFKELALAERGACMLSEAPAPMAVVRLGEVLTQKFGSLANPANAEAARKYLARQAHFAVILHEMGHSVGMRHNFISSSDAFNYRPQYWALRTDAGENLTTCTDLSATGEDCVGPRWFDPVNKNESDNMIHMFMHSSVMDYAGEPTQDLMGLGAYDFAAVRMFYGNAVAVYGAENNQLKSGQALGGGILEKMDSFGGLIGIPYAKGPNYYGLPGDRIHYSQLQKEFNLSNNCRSVNPEDFKPAGWNENRDGAWHQVLDGTIVSVDGQPIVCRDLTVDYVPWNTLGNKPGGGPAVTSDGRLRVPYGFATDGWADLGNVSVYRHDNGADPYEIFDFLITQQEVWHIYDNYRRGRQSFSIKSAASRSLGRYNTKIRDGAKGLTLIKNIVTRDQAANNQPADQLWAAYMGLLGDNIVAAGLAFDHFVRNMAKPHSGPYELSDSVDGSRYLKPMDQVSGIIPPQMQMPNGVVGGFGDFWVAGRPLNNNLADNQGEYDRDFDLWAGSYYDKINVAMLMTESEDNFISSSRDDFYDGRFRAVALADLFPEGYRRWVGNVLTGDNFLTGMRAPTSASGNLLLAGKIPAEPLGQTSWWTDEPEVCFPRAGTTFCTTWNGSGFETDSTHGDGRAIDPQIGWEQQKFIIAWTLLYLPENETSKWVDMFRIWEAGVDSDPGFTNRIEFHTPDGRVFVARTYGKETIFGKEVQRGIGARVLQWANTLLKDGYETTDGPDLDLDGSPDWYVPVLDGSGFPSYINSRGQPVPGATACQTAGCYELYNYQTIPAFIRQTLEAYGLDAPERRGVFD